MSDHTQKKQPHMTGEELDAACEEYSNSRERTEKLVHQDKVRREMGEMEKELYRRSRERTALNFPPPAPTANLVGQTFLIRFEGIGFAKSKCVEHRADHYKFDVEVEGEIKSATIFWDDWLDLYSAGYVKPIY